MLLVRGETGQQLLVAQNRLPGGLHLFLQEALSAVPEIVEQLEVDNIECLRKALPDVEAELLLELAGIIDRELDAFRAFVEMNIKLFLCRGRTDRNDLDLWELLDEL